MSIKKNFYGKTKEGKSIDIYTLNNSKGMEAEITNLGGIVVSIKAPDRFGDFQDVVLGFDRFEDYLNNISGFGALIGRSSNRIENASIEINGEEYKLSQNCGKHLIHGGFIGFDRVVWEAKVINKNKYKFLQLSYTSWDGEEGFPGELQVKVSYTLTEDNELRIDYYAVSDKDTVVNMTNHSYFNLLGQVDSDILSHELMIDSDYFTVINDECIVTGGIRSVMDTPMDFRFPKAIGLEIFNGYEQLNKASGYDHNYILKVKGKTPEKFAELYEETTGRFMEVFTTMPGVQLYTGNFLTDSRPGKSGVIYKKRSGVCLETQFYPNSLKHKHFPSPVLKAGEEYKHTTIYKFSTK